MSVAFVTGAGVRVGRAIALGLAGAGYDVVVHANANVAAAHDVAKEIEALGRVAWVESADLSDDDAIDALATRVVSAHPALDVVVHSAAGFEKVPFPNVTRAQYRAMQRVNLEAPYFLTQRLLPALQRAKTDGGDPCVVHVVDVAGERPVSGYSHYSVSKAGVAMLTRALALELAPLVRVNGVAPGTVAFPPDFDDAAKRGILKRIPLGREGSPDDVARAVVFLVGASYITGAIIPVDGGRAAGL